jgi:glutamate synthase (NADPH/NADH) small chain
MRKISGDFLEIDRKSRARTPSVGIELRPVQERLCDLEDVVIPMDAETAKLEAARCVQCPDPAPCMLACPLHNDIPSAMWMIEQGRFLEAAAIYRETSSMPEICGRVCPQEQLCQGSCAQDKSNAAVQTGPLEAFVMEFERMHGEVNIPVGKPSGRHVAVVGAGPAGLSCAEQLVQKGHRVTVYESKPAPGGWLTYGIPGFKLPKWVVSDRIGDLKRAGVNFKFSTRIGADKTIDDLKMEGCDAVFVGVGAQIDAPMEIPGEDLPGVYAGGDGVTGPDLVVTAVAAGRRAARAIDAYLG